MTDKPASEQIDDMIKLYGGWKGKMLSQLRAVIMEAELALTEEIKWKMRSRPEGLPVWTQSGIVCMVETFKNDMKLVFPKGTKMKDPQQLFNARLESSAVRAIQFCEGDTIDKNGVKSLVLEAVKLNKAKT
jgi:hypothetical protein